jgi:Anti-sigma-K factor rskA/Putative zinc-finger
VTAKARLDCDDVRDLAPAYVLGALESAEEAAVRDHLADCRRPHPEIADLGSVVPAFAEAVELVEPPPQLRDRIMAAAAAEPRTSSSSGMAAEAGGPMTAVAAPSQPAPISIVRARSRRGWLDASPSTWVLRAAAVLLIGVLGAWNVLLQGQVSTLNRFGSGVATVARAAAEPGSVSGVLASEGSGGPHGVAAVRPDGSVVIAASGLAPTRGSEVYEAWVIAPGGAPVPVGSFAVGADGTGILDGGTGAPVVNGATVGLTREPGPGATTPTLPMVSNGTVRGGSA